MNDKYQYRLTKNQKKEIAQNLIDIYEKNASLNQETKRFIEKWIFTGPEHKRKAFFDVWDIVLKKFLPTTRPILFRACKRISKNGKIASFTGSFECAKRFCNSKGSLIICDTNETLAFEETFYKPGNYIHTFFPLVAVLVKIKKSGEWGFSGKSLNDYIGEDEYIMRISLGNMNGFKWAKNNR